MADNNIGSVLLRQAEHEKDLDRKEASGVRALKRLVVIAQNDSGQPRIVRRFLLGLYNGERWPFDMTDLRCLDAQILADCLLVLGMDAAGPRREVHKYIDGGDDLFREWWFEFRPDDRPEGD